jgi:serine/threonine protein phosphatase 1
VAFVGEVRSVFAALKRVFRTPEPEEAVEAPAVAPGLAYAVGDVHGRLDLLDDLMGRIEADRAAAEPPSDGSAPLLIFLGDLIDRGPDSRGVIDRVLELKRDPRWRVRTLKGNHEEAMLLFLEDAGVGPTWAEYGGGTTLASYGVVPPRTRTEPAAWEAAREALAQKLDPGHLALLRALELSVVFGDYVFVHAGVRPGVPLDQQSEQDLLWIRGEFLETERACDKVVVHGHTPAEEPHRSRWRIGVDTGAYATGVLTALKLDGTEQGLLQARRSR